MADIFDQIHADQSGGGDVFDQIHAENQPPNTKPGWATFKSNMGEVGSVGEYLHAARIALGLPSLDDVLHLPANLVGWAKHGNPPSGGFLSENPIADAATTASAAVMPPDLASARSAAGAVTNAATDLAGDVAAGARGAVTAGAKSLAKPRSLATTTAIGVAHQLGLGPEATATAAALGAIPVVTDAYEGMKKAIAKRNAPAPAPKPARPVPSLIEPAEVSGSAPRPDWRQSIVDELNQPAAAAAPPTKPSTAVEPPPELTAGLNATPEAAAPAAPPDVPPTSAPTGGVEPPAEATAGLNGNPAPRRANGRLSRAAAQTLDDIGATRARQSVDTRAQYLMRTGITPEMAARLVDPELDAAARDGLWQQVEQGYQNDKFNQKLAQGGMTQADAMKLNSVKPTDPAMRSRVITRFQQLQQEAAAAKAARTAPGGGMGAMKNYRGTYNPAALTDEQIAGLNQ